MKVLFFTLLLLVSCTRKATLTKETFGLKVSDVIMDITQLNEIHWWIGAKRKEEKVTQSFTFLIEMPRMRQEDTEYLMKERGVDSWLVRVIQVKGSQSQDLGSLLTPFKPVQHGRSTSGDAPTHAAVKIYYAAAYASERLRNFNCPAFSHDKRISDMTVKGEDKPIEIILGTSISYREKAQQVQLSPSSFNGGNTLTGEFHLAIAPYDSVKKNLLGPFIPIPRYVEVTSEKSVYVESCKGVHQELD